MNATTQAPATAGAQDPYASRPWLSSYPSQVPADDRRGEDRHSHRYLPQGRRGLSEPGRHRELRQAHDLCRFGSRGRCGGLMAAGAGAEEGRSGGDHAAERDGLSRHPVRSPAGRRHRGQRQSALYAARAHLSAQGFRRTLPVRAGELRGNRSGIAARGEARSRGAGDARRSARSQGRHRQSGFTACEEGGEAVPAAAGNRLQGRHCGGCETQSRNRCPFRPRTSRSCNIRAARPASPRAPRCSIATWPPT